jgi:hypothetical protein
LFSDADPNSTVDDYEHAGPAGPTWTMRIRRSLSARRARRANLTDGHGALAKDVQAPALGNLDPPLAPRSLEVLGGNPDRVSFLYRSGNECSEQSIQMVIACLALRDIFCG